VDATTGSALGDYRPSHGGYDGLPANYVGGTWSPGDELSVSADGDELGAFTVIGDPRGGDLRADFDWTRGACELRLGEQLLHRTVTGRVSIKDVQSGAVGP
jgi:hypothetical protein